MTQPLSVLIFNHRAHRQSEGRNYRVGKRPKTGGQIRTSRFDTFCKFAYELAALLAVVTLILSAIHATATYHVAFDETIDSEHVGAIVDNPGRFVIGKSYPVYRFNHDWEAPIGEVRADSILENRVTFSFDPTSFAWPMSKHGRVLACEGGILRINIGANDSVTAGKFLSLFDGRTKIGEVQLAYVWPHESAAQLVRAEKNLKPADTVGKTVSENGLATQVAVFNSPLIGALDFLTIAGLLVVYIYFWVRYRSSPLTTLGPKLAARLHPRPEIKLAFHIVVGPPALWFATRLALHAVTYLTEVAYGRFNLSPIPHALTDASLQPLVLPLAVILAVVYELVLWKTRTSPFALLARRVAFREGIFGHPAREPMEHVATWCMQAVIVFAFARLLSGFFQGNLQLAISQSWPAAPPVIGPGGTNPVSLEALVRSAQAVGYAMTHLPQPGNQDLAFATLRGFINNACILGGLFGYSYSMIAYLWGKRVRNVDFTATGWLVNAICYGPFLGVVLWQMVPSQVGADPTVTNGAFRTTTFVVETFANVIYTLSIWNLGTMFGLMTDKGVRTSGFYSVVRHPSYTIEALMFVLVFCRGLSTYAQWLAVGSYFLIYWLRSEREDQFMTASNPDYQTYRERVKYKYLPGVY